MIKLKELLELRNMKYAESVRPKDEKRMSRTLELWDENLVLPKRQPPENDSSLTLKEIKYLSNVEPNEKFATSHDDVVDSFMELIEKNSLDISRKDIKKIVKESVKFIMELKYHYNRPRPYQVAEFYDIDLNGTTLDSMKTPSYPSGHAIQGYLIGDYLSHKDPSNSEEYLTKGSDIAESRIVAKAHYPSDRDYGKQVAKVLFRGMKK
jgi:hypothetical protein